MRMPARGKKSLLFWYAVAALTAFLLSRLVYSIIDALSQLRF